MMRKFFNVLILVFFISALSACNFTGSEESAPGNESASNNENESSSEQVLNLIEENDIASLDYVAAHDAISGVALSNTKEGLYRLDENHNPVLAAASDHEVSEDGLVHTFTIRDHVWSNGDPVTAHDFEYAWKRTFEEIGYYMYIYENAKILNASAIMEGEKGSEELGIEAIDEETLEITLSAPSPLFVNYMTFTAFLPANQAFVEKAGEDYGTEFDQVLYNGPFVLTDWNHNQNWTYEKNSDYWDAATVKMEEVNVNVVKEESTAVNLYKTGEVDLIEITAAHVDEYKDDPNYETVETAGLKFLRFNHNNEVLNNTNIRRALDMSWNKEDLTNVILKNGSTPTEYLVPDIATGPSGETFRSMNGDFGGTIEEGQDYWQQGLEELGQESVELDVLVADDTDSRATAEYLKNQWETNLEGVTINLVVQPFQQRLELEKAIDYDISLSSYVPLTPDPLNYLDMWITGASFNRMDYSNEKYDELVEQAENETNEEKRYEIMLEAERILMEEDAAIGPMYQDATAMVRQPYVKNIIYHPSLPVYSLKWAYIEGE